MLASGSDADAATQADPFDALQPQLVALRSSGHDDSHEAVLRQFRVRFCPCDLQIGASSDEVEAHLRSAGPGLIKAGPLVDIARQLERDLRAGFLATLRMWSPRDFHAGENSCDTSACSVASAA